MRAASEKVTPSALHVILLMSRACSSELLLAFANASSMANLSVNVLGADLLLVP